MIVDTLHVARKAVEHTSHRRTVKEAQRRSKNALESRIVNGASCGGSAIEPQQTLADPPREYGHAEQAVDDDGTHG